MQLSEGSIRETNERSLQVFTAHIKQVAGRFFGLPFLIGLLKEELNLHQASRHGDTARGGRMERMEMD